MKRLITILLLLIPTIAFADRQDVRQYTKCFRLLTGTDPDPATVRFKSILEGTLDPTTACMQTLEAGALDPETDRLATNNGLGRNVLATMNRVHQSWFVGKDILIGQNGARFRLTKDLVDISSPAYYYTRALFNPDVGINTVLNSDHLMALRSEMNPAEGPAFNMPKSDTVFTNLQYLPVGDLLGIRPSGDRTYNLDGGGSASFGKTFGGGALGSPAYFHTVDPELDEADGGVEMPRLWARNVYSDFLCKDLPAVRPDDATTAVSANSEIPFRTSKECVICHISIDQSASIIRNMSWQFHGETTRPNMGAVELKRTGASLPAESGWPAVSDSNFFKRPPRGKLFFRNYAGQLVDESAQGLQAFANKILQQDDFYICVAKRYYQYFTGINVNIGDLQGADLGEPATTHRNRVVQWGKELRSDRDPNKLIEKIFSSSAFTGE